MGLTYLSTSSRCSKLQALVAMALESLLYNIDLTSLPSTSYPYETLHPFSQSSPSVAALTDLLERTSELDRSLRTHWRSNHFDTQPRLVGLLKEHTEQARHAHSSKDDAKKRLDVLVGGIDHPERRRTRKFMYGEDVPLDRENIPEFIIHTIREFRLLCGTCDSIAQSDYVSGLV